MGQDAGCSDCDRDFVSNIGLKNKIQRGSGVNHVQHERGKKYNLLISTHCLDRVELLVFWLWVESFRFHFPFQSL